MTEEKGQRPDIAALLDKAMTQRLMPLAARLIGAELATRTLMNALLAKNVLLPDEIERALRGALEALDQEQGRGGVAEPLRALLEAVAAHQRGGPAPRH